MRIDYAKELFNNQLLELSDEQFNDFEKYKELLLSWNEKINLTAIVEDEEIWIKHFFDSCTINELINKYLNGNSIDKIKMIDIGTGAGFPSIPVKILLPNLSITMVDSLNKRINFLNECIKELHLKKINAIHSRTEDLTHNNEYREQFDFATARAVANLSTLLEYTMPFVKVKGYFICMKGANIEEELKNAQNAIKILGGEVVEIKKFNLPKINDERNIIVIQKIKNTPEQYARKAGTPAKMPL